MQCFQNVPKTFPMPLQQNLKKTHIYWTKWCFEIFSQKSDNQKLLKFLSTKSESKREVFTKYAVEIFMPSEEQFKVIRRYSTGK